MISFGASPPTIPNAVTSSLASSSAFHQEHQSAPAPLNRPVACLYTTGTEKTVPAIALTHIAVIVSEILNPEKEKNLTKLSSKHLPSFKSVFLVFVPTTVPLASL